MGSVPAHWHAAQVLLCATVAGTTYRRRLKFFHELGLAILDRWQRSDFDGAAFPDIATTELSRRPPSSYVDSRDVIRWVHEAPTLVAQADIDSKFGQPAITVFRCEAFYVDVLFWVDGTTAIHQHRFSGAFHVLEGSSLQSTYRFTEARRYNERLLSGRLDLLQVELLTKGDVRPIRAGAELVHALFHLDRPSVSVVVRTPSDELVGPQYSYSRAGLAFDPFAKAEAMTRKIQTLDLLHTLGDPEFESLARATVTRADSFVTFRLLTYLAKRIDDHDKYVAFLESIRPAHGALLDALKAHAEEERRDDYIIARRRLAKQADHRFFLALLLNLPDRSHILDVVRGAFPSHPPVETILRWIAELTKVDAIHAWVAEASNKRIDGGAPRIVDVAIDEASLGVARLLLEGMPDDAAADRLLVTRPPADTNARADLLAQCAALRGSLLLRPLFTR